MKRRNTFAGTAALAAVIALSWPVVTTAAAGDQGIPAVLRLLEEILANQATLLELVSVPDLVPVPVTGVVPGQPISTAPAGFCRFGDQGRLHVFVFNQGAGPAGPSLTQVFFRVPTTGTRPSGEKSCGVGCAQVDIATLGLAPYRGTQGVGIDVPEGCFGSVFGPDDINNCQFKMSVDGANAVNESNELNNNAFGACQGLL